MSLVGMSVFQCFSLEDPPNLQPMKTQAFSFVPKIHHHITLKDQTILLQYQMDQVCFVPAD